MLVIVVYFLFLIFAEKWTKNFNSAEKICIISYFTRHHPDWIHNFVLMLLYLGNANTKSVAYIMVNIIWVTQFYSKKLLQSEEKTQIWCSKFTMHMPNRLKHQKKTFFLKCALMFGLMLNIIYLFNLDHLFSFVVTIEFLFGKSDLEWMNEVFSGDE